MTKIEPRHAARMVSQAFLSRLLAVYEITRDYKTKEPKYFMALPLLGKGNRLPKILLVHNGKLIAHERAYLKRFSTTSN